MSARLPRLLLILLIPIYVVYLLAPAVGYMHDDGIYLICARALAAGRGYVIESLPSEIAQTKYPILYPALLAPLYKLFSTPQHVVQAAKVLSFLFALGWLYLCYRWLRSELSDRAAAWIVFFTAAAPWAVYLSGSILPDTFFALVSTGSALLVTRAARSESTRRALALSAVAGSLAAAAFLARSTGAALILAVVAYLGYKRMFRAALAFCAVCACLCAPWLIWQAGQPVPTDPLTLYYSKASYTGGHIFAGYTPTQMASIFLLNAAYAANFFWPALGVWTSVAGIAVSAAAAIAITFGLWRSLRLQPSLAAFWVIAYTGMMLCWAWPPYRYLTPLAPFLLYFLARHPPRAFATPKGARFANAALLACAVLVMITLSRGALDTLRQGTPSNGAIVPDDWSETLAIAEWVRDHTPPNAIIAAGLDPAIYLYSGRKSIRPFEYKPYAILYNLSAEKPYDPEELRKQLRAHGVTYVVFGPMQGFSEGPHFRGVFEELRRTHSEAFRLVNQLPDPAYSVYQVDPRLL